MVYPKSWHLEQSTAGTKFQQIPEECRSVQRSRHREYVNKCEDTILNNVNIYNASS